jgi:hypothetical protein
MVLDAACQVIRRNSFVLRRAQHERKGRRQCNFKSAHPELVEGRPENYATCNTLRSRIYRFYFDRRFSSRRRKAREAPRRLPCRRAGLDSVLDHRREKTLAEIRLRSRADTRERRSARGAGVDRAERSVSLRLGYRRDDRPAPGNPGRAPRRNDEYFGLVSTHPTERPIRAGLERQDPRHLARSGRELYSPGEAAPR